jgi:uncharacterized FlaG/YvyC family protein
LDDDLDSFGVGQIQGSWAIKGLGEKQEQQKKEKQQQQNTPKQPKDFVRTIAKAAEASNATLMRLNLPYRFRVFAEGEEVFVEIVVLDENGNIITEKKKNISHEEFARLIEDVSQIQGLFFDSNA